MTSSPVDRDSGSPLFSIVILAHGRHELLVKTLTSVNDQSFRDFECIVVDDGSAKPVALQLSHRPAWLKLIRQTNTGPSGARNRGAATARGQFLVFLDSDDRLLSRALQSYADVV